MKKLSLLVSIIMCWLPGIAQKQLWGITSQGGQYGAGVIFKIDSLGSRYNIQHDFFNIGEITSDYTQLIQTRSGKIYGMTATGMIFQFDSKTAICKKEVDLSVFNVGGSQGFLMEASNGMLYGMTFVGGDKNGGVIFQYNPIKSILTKLVDFDGINGAFPRGSLCETKDGKLIGMTTYGGVNNKGVIFQYDLLTAVYEKRFDFNGLNGMGPTGRVIEASDGKLYGMTPFGGKNNSGVLFQYDPKINEYISKIDFSDIGIKGVYGSLVEGANGKLYGIAYSGGINNYGAIFEFDLKTSSIVLRFQFDITNGANPLGSLVRLLNGKLYGMTSQGVNGDFQGVIFEFNISSGEYKKLKVFDKYSNPKGSLLAASDDKLYGLTASSIFQYDPTGSVFQTKIDFNFNGKTPRGKLTKTSDGKLYGITKQGGVNNGGVLFQFDPLTGVYSKKVDFGAGNGSVPVENLIVASDGKLYGVTSYGGNYNEGVIFQYDPLTSVYSKLVDFDRANGAYPKGGLLQTSDGKLWGMTVNGGTSDLGVLYSYNIVTATLSKVIDFTGVNGENPSGTLMQASDGKVYGLTNSGGVYDFGILFQYNIASNTFIKKIDFDTTKGFGPIGQLCEATNKKLYGVTEKGGKNGVGVIFQYDLDSSSCTKRYDFILPNGGNPMESLLYATDGMIYGTTGLGGTTGDGTFFQYNPITNIYAKRHDFNRINGVDAMASIELSIPSVSCGLTDTFIFKGNPVSIYYNIENITIDSNNIFTAQLSDVNGSFLTPINIGSIASATADTIKANIPCAIPDGSSYRIRVVATNPLIIGDRNQRNIVIKRSQKVDFKVDNPRQCLKGNDFLFNDISNISDTTTSRVWNFGDGETSISQSPNKIFQAGGNYNVQLTRTNNNGCSDSIAKLVIVKPRPNIGIVQSGDTLKVNQVWGEYRWIDCAKNKQPIAGATNQMYTIPTTGSFAVIVTINDCSDTSECIIANRVGIDEQKFGSITQVFPNPTTGTVTVQSSIIGSYTIVNELGYSIQTFELDASNGYQHSIENLKGGLYFLTGRNENQVTTHKIVVVK